MKRGIGWYPDNTHLSQRRPLDVVLGRLQRPKDSPYFVVLVFGTGFGCGNVRLVIIPLLCPAQPMGRLYVTDITNYEPDFNFLDKMTMNHDEIFSLVKKINEE